MDFEVDESTLQRWKEVATSARWCSRILSQIGDPVEKSTFRQVNEIFVPEKASDWCRGYLQAAVEHLEFWADFVAPLKFHPEHSVRHTFRPVQSLARAAMEAAAQAVWVMSAESPTESARRHLSQIRWDIEERRKMLPLDEKHLATEEDTALLAAVGGRFSDTDTRPQSYLSLLRSAAPYIGRDPWDVETIWRAASGSAHGKRWPALALQTVVPGEEYELGQFRTTAIADPVAISSVVGLADKLTARGVELFITSSGANFAALHEEAIGWLASISPLKDGVTSDSIRDFALGVTDEPTTD